MFFCFYSKKSTFFFEAVIRDTYYYNYFCLKIVLGIKLFHYELNKFFHKGCK